MYAVAIGVARVTGVVVLPLLTRRLSDTELGVFGLLTSALLLFQFASGLGLDSAATRGTTSQPCKASSEVNWKTTGE